MQINVAYPVYLKILELAYELNSEGGQASTDDNDVSVLTTIILDRIFGLDPFMDEVATEYLASLKFKS